MRTELRKESWKPFDRFALGAVCAALALVFAYLTLFSLLYTSSFLQEGVVAEHVTRQRDSLWLNLFLVAGLLALLRLLLRFEKSLSLSWCTGILLGLVFAVGTAWSFSIRVLPRADAWACYDTAVRLAAGEPVALLDYYRLYPFQAGYTLYCELFVRLFAGQAIPAIGCANALLLALSYGAVLALLWDSRRSRRLQLCAMVLLALMIQPLFYIPFVYGTVPGLALSLWAVVPVQRWVRQRRWWQLPVSAVLCALAVALKPNSWIMVIALFLVLALYCLSTRRFGWLAPALALLLVPILVLPGLQKGFEARIGERLGKGTPQAAWLAMGLQEGPRAAGWYNGYTGALLERHDFDPEAAGAQVREDIRERLTAFAATPAYGASFFHNKMVSQWGETTFESFLISGAVKFTQEPPALIQQITAGEATPGLQRYMDGFTILLYLGFATGLMLWVFGKAASKRPWEEVFAFGVLVVAIFGGWLYHMLFEAKSQYLVIYLPMMVPFAALALASRVRLFKARS